MFPKSKKITVNFIPVIKGHYGGDEGIVKATIGMMTGNSDNQSTWIADTIESLVVFQRVEHVFLLGRSAESVCSPQKFRGGNI